MSETIDNHHTDKVEDILEKPETQRLISDQVSILTNCVPHISTNDEKGEILFKTNFLLSVSWY